MYTPAVLAVLAWRMEPTFIAPGWRGNDTFVTPTAAISQRKLNETCNMVNEFFEAAGDPRRVGNSMGEFVPYQLKRR
jgi:hypothetical protein